MHVFVGVGSASEGRFAGTGISHFVEHMLFKGTERRGVGEIAREIESLGGEMNAFTSADATRYTIAIPSRHTAKALEVMADAIFSPAFDAGEVEKEREVILGELRLNEDDPERKLYRHFWETAYLAHPYRYPVIGYEALFRSISRDDLISFYREQYVPNNIVLAVVGDVDPDEVMRDIQTHFGPSERKRFLAAAPPAEQDQLSERAVEIPLPIEQIYLMLGYHGPPLNHPDLYAMDVLAIILGEGASSRLVRRFKEDEEWVLSIQAASHTPRDAGLFIIRARLLPDRVKLDRLLKGVSEEIALMTRSGPKRDELEKAKAIVLSQFLFGQQDAEGQAGDLASSWALTGDTHFSARYVEGIRRVTAQDVRRVGARYFSDSKRTVLSLVPAALSGPGEAAAGETGGSEIHITTLPNGLKLITQSVPHVPIVSLYLAMKGGVSFDEKPGLSNFMSAVWTKGTERRSDAELARTLETLGASLGSYSGNNTFGISAGFLSEHLDTILSLLHEIVTQPAFRAEEVEKVRRRILAEIDREADNPFQTAGRLLRGALFKGCAFGHPAIGTRESIEGMTRAELISFYNTFSVPQNMVLSIAGDIDEERVAGIVEKHFSRLPASEVPVVLPVLSASGSGPEAIRKTLEEKEQTILILGFPTGMGADHPDRHALSVVNGLLSGQGGRLYKRIREELGLAYTLGAYQVLGIAGGFETVYVATTHEGVETCRKVVEEELERLRSGEISDQELGEVKTHLIGSQELALETLGAVAEQTALDELLGNGYLAFKSYAEDINRVTIQDIRRIFEERLKAGSEAKVIVGP